MTITTTTTSTLDYFVGNYGQGLLWIMGAFTLVTIFFLVYNLSKELINWFKKL